MHIHATQPNPYAQLDALRSAQKNASKREAELVRKKLLESASEVAGESDVSDLSVAPMEERGESQRQPKRRNRQNGALQKRSSEPEPTDSDDGDKHISDWA